MPDRRVVMLSGFFPRVGGAEQQAGRLARALADRGARVRVVTQRGDDAFPERDAVEGIPVHRILYPRIRGIGTVVLLLRVFADLLRGNDDIIHVHVPGPLLIAALAAGRLKRTPVILKFANLSPERGIWVDLPHAFFKRWPIEAATRRVDGVVAISSRIARAAEEGGWRSIAEIPNGIDPVACAGEHPPRSQARRTLGIEGSPVVLFVGRLGLQKGIDTLLEAWPRFLARRPGALLVILGEGREGPRLKAMAEALHIAGSVDFRGFRGDVGQHYAAADIFVLPSRYEGFPNVMLEAMAAGLPVVASRVSGTEDAIESGRNGLLVPSGDAGALCEALLTLAADQDLAGALGREARKTVEGRFNIKVVAEATMAFYNRLLSRR